jgi:tetrahedral aminopeptidase
MAKKPSRTSQKHSPRPAARKTRSGRQEISTDIDLLAGLSNAIGVSGAEGAVRRLVLEAIEGHVDEVRVDALGNVLAVKRAARRSGQALRLLVAAHMDEVGLMIVDHDSDGSLRFGIVGGVNERTLLGQPVIVGPRRLTGVISAAPIHLLPAERKNQPVKPNQMRIDIGAGNQETARRHVALGDRAGFATGFAQLQGAVRGKALDDRLGCATLVTLLRGGPYPVELHAAFTVQEEVGLRGASVAGYAVEPHAAIALDCAPAYDLPHSRGTENVRYNAQLGRGPVIYRVDGRTLSDRRLADFLCQMAENAGLPFQIRQPGPGSTDASAVQLGRSGVPVVSMSVPARYVHTPAALARLDDWRHAAQLLLLAVEQFNPKVLKPLT